MLLPQNQTTFCLITGIVVGFTVAFLILAPSSVYRPKLEYYNEHTRNLHRHEQHDFHHEEDMDDLEGPIEAVGEHDANDTFHRMTDTRLSDALYKKVRILCWVMTGPKNHESKAKHVKATWGKRCNKLLFMSSEADQTLPAIALDVKEGRDNLWAKTKASFKYVYDHHFDDADWFMKADDDTYVILENLRYMLHAVDPNDPIYYGCRFKPYVKQGYMSGGAGYVLSKEALRRFVEDAIPNQKVCRGDNGGAEDVEIGKCLYAVNVLAGDSRDPEQRGRFFPFSPSHHLIPGHVDKNFWYWSYIYYNESQGMDCCSDNAISFHYIDPTMMYVLEYFIYHLRPFGIAYNPQLPDLTKEPFSDHQKVTKNSENGNKR